MALTVIQLVILTDLTTIVQRRSATNSMHARVCLDTIVIDQYGHAHLDLEKANRMMLPLRDPVMTPELADIRSVASVREMLSL